MFDNIKEVGRAIRGLFTSELEAEIGDCKAKCEDALKLLESMTHERNVALEDADHYKRLYQQGLAVVVGAQYLIDKMDDFLSKQKPKKSKIGKK